MVNELMAAIEALYVAFAGYRRPERIAVCSCCWPSDDVERSDLGAIVEVVAPGGPRPLRELTADDLAGLAELAPVLAGSVEVHKHYLPRVLEIAISEGFEDVDLELVFSRLNDSCDGGRDPWTAWPESERTALRAFFEAVWRDRLASVYHDDGSMIDSTLCALGVVVPGVGWYLEEWLRFEHPHAAVNLRRFIERNSHDLMRGRLGNPFWSHHDPAAKNQAAVVAWTRAQSTRDAVAEAADRARTTEEADALQELYLRWLAPPIR